MHKCHFLFYLLFSFCLTGQSVIQDAEYFWGSIDPGPGNGTQISANDGSFDEALEGVVQNNANNPSTPGLNLFNIRVKDSEGNWGPIYRRAVNKSIPRDIKITSGEYFWGINDPGAGSGTSLLAFDGDFDEALEQIFKDSITFPSTAGAHSFSVRIRDDQNEWGPVYRRTVFIYDSTSTSRDLTLTAAEFFWGANDPGLGNGTALLAFDGDFDESLETLFKNNVNTPSSLGMNLFNIRVKDSDGNWGPLYRRTIYKSGTPRDLKLTSGEYFWGTVDPGEGNGTVMFAFDGDYDEAFEQIFKDSLGFPSTAGAHSFNLRIKDDQNSWGPVYRRTILISDTTSISRDFRLLAGEFFWGTSDPGHGNGIQILTSDGGFDEVIEQLHASNAFSPGPGIQLFNIRVKDYNDEWGPLYKRAIDVQIPENDLEIINLTGSDTICRGDTIVLQAFGGFDMLWFSDTLNSYSADSLVLVPDSSFQIMLTGYNPYEGNDTAHIDITVGQHLAVNINLGIDSLSFCGVDSILLDAGPGYDIYGWSPGQFTTGETCLPFTFTGGINAQSIYAQESGTYYVQVTDSLNCSSMDSIVVSLLGPTLIGPTSIFEGDTVSLVASIDGVGFLLESYDTVFVNPSQSIQQALDTAESGTVIMLASGTYTENIIWPQTDHLILSSVDGPEQTIIDGSAANESVIYIGNGQIGAVVDNLHITNGYGSLSTFHSSIPFGGGISIDQDVRGVISNCLITHNGIAPSNEYSGGVFVSQSSEVYVVNNTIADNYGPGIWWRTQSGGNCFDATMLYGSDGALINNVIANNQGYGLYNQSGLPQGSYSIRFNNSVDNSGSCVSLSNWYNSICGSGYTETSVNGNISENPLFEDASNGNYQLSSGSPSEASGENGAKMGYEGDFELSNLVYSPETITYNWSTGESSQNITIAPTESTTYGIDVGSGSNACSESITVVVFPYLKDSICANELYDFNGTSLSEAGVYIDTLTDISGQDSLIKLSLTVLDLPDVFAGYDQDVCIGESVILNGSGANSGGVLLFSLLMFDSWGDGWNGSSITILADGTPVLTATLDNGSVGSETFSAPEGAVITATWVAGSFTSEVSFELEDASGAIVAGGGFGSTIDYSVPSGSGNGLPQFYFWDNGVSDGVDFTPPLGATNYTVIGTDSFGCQNTDDVEILVNPLPDVQSTSVTACDEDSISLNGSGALDYVWNNGVTDGELFEVDIDSLYIVSGTDINGCVGIDTAELTIYELPNVFAGDNQDLCLGDSLKLNGLGADTYLWDNNVIDDAYFIPVVGVQVYTVQGIDTNGCVNTDDLILTVHDLPNVFAGDDQELCNYGDLLTLSATGAETYEWTNDITDGIGFLPSLGTTTYTVTGTDANDCVNTDDIEIIVNPLPNVNAGLDQSICIGEFVVLNGSGATDYVWSDNIENGLSFSPLVGDYEFIVTGTDMNECSNTDSVFVYVNEYLTPEFNVIDPICSGDIFILPGTSINGIQGFWSPPINPFITTSYSFLADAGQCADSYEMLVDVLPLPNVFAGDDQDVCIGESVTLNGSGAYTYAWSDGVNNGVAFNPSPGTSVYTVNGTDGNGCSNTDDILVEVYDLPAINAGPDQELCEGNTTVLSASGNGTFTWSGGVINNQQFIPTVGTNNYTVYTTDINGCSNSDVVQVLVNPKPTVNAGIDQFICEGESLVLNASGANSYEWSDDIENGIAFQPTPGVYQYSVIGYNQFACSDQDIVQVTVHPTVYGTDEQEACDSYTWIDGNQYTESNNSASWTLNNVNGCDSIVTLDLSMNYQSDTVLYVSSLGAYKLNGYTYTEAGVYQQDTLTEFGCDSTIIINLDIDDSGVESLSEYGISLYPNPFWSELTLLLEKPDPDIYVLLVDINGRKIFELNSLSIKNNFELSFLESGVYYLNIHQKDSILGRVKLVKR